MPTFNKYGATDDVILQDGDRAFMRMNTRLRPNQLQPGEVAYSQNGRMETNGTWQPREGYDNLTGALEQDGVALYALIAGSAGIISLIADTAIAAADIGITSAGKVTMTVTGHGLSSATTHALAVEDLTFATTDPNGNRVLTVVDANTLEFALAGANETYGVAGTPTIESPKLDESTLVEVLGSCTFSDPTDAAKEFIVIATNVKAVAYELGAADVAASAIDIDYPAAQTLSSGVSMVQAFDEVYIFQDGDTAWKWDGDFGGGLAFAEVPSGAKTQHKVFQATNNTVIASGVATVTEAEHGLAAGDTIYLVDSSDVDVTANAAIAVATVPNANSFTFLTNASDVTASIIYTTKASRLGGGYVNMPGAPWAVYHQRRFWMPYTHDSASPPVNRNVLDELVASDILDPTTFDPVGNQFVVTAGLADYIVAVHPFNDDNLLAFNRNSIHLMKGVSGSLGDVETVEITREIGCSARKSAVTYGNQVLFLSDNGVYSLSFLDEYNLRGTELPLSEAITNLTQRINADAVANAVAIYHDNRYFLAVPLDGSTENNAILVYSFLNGGWESLDTTSATNFNVLSFHVGRAGEANELYAVTTTGGVYQLTATGRMTDELINNTVSNEITEFTIPATVTTRQYDMNSLDRKKWNRAEIQVKSHSGAASDGGFSVEIEDPDSSVTLSDIGAIIGTELPRDEGASIVTRIGNNRGWGASLVFSPTLGRPSLQSVRLRGMATFNSGTSVT